MQKSATKEERAVTVLGCIAFQWKAMAHAVEKKAMEQINRDLESESCRQSTRIPGAISAKGQKPIGGQANPSNKPAVAEVKTRYFNGKWAGIWTRNSIGICLYSGKRVTSGQTGKGRFVNQKVHHDHINGL